MLNLNQITIPSKDLVKSVKFYKTLGLNLIVDSIPRYARFECLKGEATLSLHHVENIAEGEGIVVYFEVEKLDEYIKTLIGKGLIFEDQPEDKSWLWRECRLKDPDGHQIILYYAGVNRKDPPWKIK